MMMFPDASSASSETPAPPAVPLPIPALDGAHTSEATTGLSVKLMLLGPATVIACEIVDDDSRLQLLLVHPLVDGHPYALTDHVSSAAGAVVEPVHVR